MNCLEFINFSSEFGREGCGCEGLVDIEPETESRDEGARLDQQFILGFTFLRYDVSQGASFITCKGSWRGETFP